MVPKRIALFASGSGTNAENIIRFFSSDNHIVVDSLMSNRYDAFALKRAENMGIPTFVFSKEQFYRSDEIPDLLRSRKIDLIVLAGFLWLIPENLIKNFTILNIHPALLPKYGGKGMYGHRVHEAVVNNHELESGITIHLVNEKYDEGKIVFQTRCPVLPDDSPDDVAGKVHQLEYEFFPKVIRQYLEQKM